MTDKRSMRTKRKASADDAAPADRAQPAKLHTVSSTAPDLYRFPDLIDTVSAMIARIDDLELGRAEQMLPALDRLRELTEKVSTMAKRLDNVN